MSFLSSKLPRTSAQLRHRRDFSTTLKLNSVQNPFANSDVISEFDRQQEVVREAEEDVVTSQEILKHRDYFDVEKLANLEDLYKNRCHFGHYKGNRNEHMKPYLFGCRQGVDIIDLDKTKQHLFKALNFIAHMAYRRAVVLFVHQSSQFGHQVELSAKSCGEFSHTRMWSAGLFANNKLGDPDTTPYPDVCIFLSTMSGSHQEHPALHECAKVGIATVGVVDSNANPSLVTYPVPGNDDSLASVNHYLDVFTKAVKAGKLRRELDDVMDEEIEL